MPDHPADEPPEPTPPPRRRFRRGASTSRSRAWLARWAGAPGSSRRVVALLAAVALLLGLLAAAGTGQTSAAQPALDGGAWLGSDNGSLVHANGVSARIDWTTSITGSLAQVTQDQTGGFIDQGDGHFLTIDGAAMKVGNTTEIDGTDVEIDSGGSKSFVVYRATGIVQQVNPITLDAVGDAVDLGGAVGSAGVDAQGVLYAALNETHQIAVVNHGRLDSLIGDGSDANAQIVTVGTDVTAVDTTAGVALLLHGDGVAHSLSLGTPAGTQFAIPTFQSGATLWITDVTHRQLLGIGLDGNHSQTVDLPASVVTPTAAQPAGDQLYLFDPQTGSLATIDTVTGSARTQKLLTAAAKPEFFGKDGLVYVNDFSGPQAWVGNDQGTVSPLQKYAVAKPLPKPVAKPLAKKPVKKLAPQLKKKPVKRRVIPKIHPRPKPKPRPKPVFKPRPKPTTTTKKPKPTTTTTTNPDDTTTTNPNSTTTTDPNSTTTTTTDPNSTTTTTNPDDTTTTDPNSTTTTVPPPGP